MGGFKEMRVPCWRPSVVLRWGTGRCCGQPLKVTTALGFGHRVPWSSGAWSAETGPRVDLGFSTAGSRVDRTVTPLL